MKNEIFLKKLGIDQDEEWEIKYIKHNKKNKKITIMIEYYNDKFYCPECGRLAPFHDKRKRTLRHLNLKGNKTYIVVNYARVKCIHDGVLPINPPFAVKYSRYTLAFEQWITEICRSKSIEGVAKHLKMDWHVIAGIYDRQKNVIPRERKIIKYPDFTIGENKNIFTSLEQNNNRIYLLAELDDEIQNKIQNIEMEVKKEFNSLFLNNIPYHITLCSCSIENQNLINELIDKIENDIKEFKIKYNSFGIYKLKLIYLSPILNFKLLKLINFIKRNSTGKRNHNFSLYTPLLYDKPDNILKILNIIGNKYGEIEGKIKYISIYKKYPNELIKKIELKA